MIINIFCVPFYLYTSLSGHLRAHKAVSYLSHSCLYFIDFFS